MLQPKLRFPGFEGRWASKKFGELYSFRSTNSLSRDNLNFELGIVKNIHYGDIHTKFESHFDILKEKVPFVNPDVNLSRISQDNYLREGDLVIADASEDYNDIGKTIEVINLNNESVLAGLHTFLARKESNEIFLGFPTFVLKSRKVRLDIMKIAQGTKVLSLSSNRLGNIFLDFPSLPEQTKIASFLSTVDEKIQHLKKQLSLQELYKKGVMQKIFSHEIRFKDENGNDFPEWEEKPIYELFDSKKGTGLSKNKVSKTGRNKCLLYGELFTTYGENITEIVSYTDSSEGVISEFNDILVPGSTTTCGIDLAKFSALKVKGVLIGGDVTIMRAKELIDSTFYAYYLSNFKKREIGNKAQGITIVHLSFLNFMDILIHYPNEAEQKKIASFLSSIDNKIEKNKEQIRKMELWKKGLLQQMFV
jgi:type I restriction enzyme S subunit